MTNEERLDWIDRLQRENAEARDRIAARERQRLEDPLGFDHPADRRLTGDPADLAYGEPLEAEGGPYARRGGGAGLLYRMGPENAPAPASQPAGAPSSDGLSLDADAVAQAIADALFETRAELRREFARELAILKNENTELKGMLGAVLAIIGKSGTLSTLDNVKSADVHHLPRGFLRVQNG
jgi:hypothetical protein